MDEEREPVSKPPPTITHRHDGWVLVGDTGEVIVGPFRTLQELEDWMDWRDNQQQRTDP